MYAGGGGCLPGACVPPQSDAVRATLLNDLRDFAFQVTTFPALLFLAASSYAIQATRRLPRVLGHAAAIAAALQVVVWVSFFAPSGPLAAGGIPSIIAFAALLAWTVACSLTMVARGARALIAVDRKGSGSSGLASAAGCTGTTPVPTTTLTRCTALLHMPWAFQMVVSG